MASSSFEVSYIEGLGRTAVAVQAYEPADVVWLEAALVDLEGTDSSAKFCEWFIGAAPGEAPLHQLPQSATRPRLTRHEYLPRSCETQDPRSILPERRRTARRGSIRGTDSCLPQTVPAVRDWDGSQRGATHCDRCAPVGLIAPDLGALPIAPRRGKV